MNLPIPSWVSWAHRPPGSDVGLGWVPARRRGGQGLWGEFTEPGAARLPQELSGRMWRHQADVLLRNLGRDGLCVR